MADWIVGLRKAAVESRPGASEDDLTRVEELVGLPLPSELRNLYAQMNGGSFEPDVALYALEQAPDAAGVVETTRHGLGGLPARGVWRFGLRGGGDQLFAVRRGALDELPPAVSPGWMRELPSESWLFGRKNTDTGELELFKSLQALLWNLIPPVESEDFGEHTYAKAMNAVQEALQAFEEVAPPGKKGKKKAPKAKPKAKRPARAKAAKAKKAAKKRR
ncbi:MAG TPA: SMI1/KNR4 family protein [Myxococcales bacterium]|nr:SMI1/KNR4 family protein [Myxococcales bacterium]